MTAAARVTFSLATAALSLASSRHTPRMPRNFMRDMPDRGNQIAPGLFVCAFVRCPLAPRAIRGRGEAFTPSLPAVLSIALAVLSNSFPHSLHPDARKTDDESKGHGS